MLNFNRIYSSGGLLIGLLLICCVARADLPSGYSVLETINYEYDAEGNRIVRGATVTGVPETPIGAQYDSGNRLTQITLKGQGPNGSDTVCTLAYDANGNLTAKTCSTSGGGG